MATSTDGDGLFLLSGEEDCELDVFLVLWLNNQARLHGMVDAVSCRGILVLPAGVILRSDGELLACYAFYGSHLVRFDRRSSSWKQLLPYFGKCCAPVSYVLQLDLAK